MIVNHSWLETKYEYRNSTMFNKRKERIARYQIISRKIEISRKCDMGIEIIIEYSKLHLAVNCRRQS